MPRRLLLTVGLLFRGILFAITVSAENGTLDELRENFCPTKTYLNCLVAYGRNRPCCVGCSCAPTCESTGNCCQTKSEHNSLIESGSLQCLHPDTRRGKTPYQLPMYQFMVHPPAGGCNGIGSCNQSEKLIPWKTFQPVFSREKMKNYLNEECAKCHGVTDGLKWTSRLAMVAIETVDMVDILQFLRYKQSNGLFTIFDHPGHLQDKIQTSCLTDMSDRCFNEAYSRLQNYLPPPNISFEEMRLGCFGGMNLHTYLENIYKSEWCSLCGSFLPKERCSSGTNRNTAFAFTTMLDHEFIEKIGKSHNETVAQFVCKKLNKTINACREIYCPAMQIRGPDGNCVFPTQHWFLDLISLTLNLTAPLSGNSSAFFMNMSQDNVLNAFKKSSPWHKCWIIYDIGKRYYINGDKEILEFFVQMHCGVNTVDPNAMILAVRASLSNPWVIDLGDSVIPFRQHFAKYPTQEYQNTTVRVLAPVWMQSSNEKVTITESVVPMWEILFRKQRVYNQRVHITKMFFCPMVELVASEYEIDRGLDTVQLEETQKILFNFEFLVSRLSKERLTVCIEDVGYEIVPVENHGSLVTVEPRWFLSLIITALVIIFFLNI